MSVGLEKLKKNLLSKEDALEKVSQYESCEEMVFSGKVQFQEHPNKGDHYLMNYRGKEYEVGLDAFIKLNRLLGIPHTYVRKVPSNLLFPHLVYWLSVGDKEVKGFIKKTTGADRISGFARPDAYYYPISRIFSVVDKVQSGYLVEGLEDVSWRNSTFGLVFPDHVFDINDKDAKKGDILYGGVKIRNSLLGEFPFRISAFLLTLACLNGMTSIDEVYTYNRKSGFDGQDDWIEDGINNAVVALNAEVEKVRNLTEQKISNEDIPPYITHVFDQMNVNRKAREAILNKVVEKNPKNLYQLMNAVTSVTHTYENRNEVYDLQRIGGFLASHTERCARCKRPF